MAYDFYIGTTQLPITPSKLNIKINSKNKTVSLINDGEINILKSPGLTDISFTTLLPNVQYPFAVYRSGFVRASYYMEILNALKVSKQPFQFIVSRFTPGGQRLFDTNIRVSLEDYSIDENAGNGIDINVEIKLKQYRDFSTKTIIIEEGLDTPAATAVVTVNETRAIDYNWHSGRGGSFGVLHGGQGGSFDASHSGRGGSFSVLIPVTVEENDTLWSIAKKTYGDGSKYKKILTDNQGQLDNINALKPGQILMLTK